MTAIHASIFAPSKFEFVIIENHEQGQIRAESSLTSTILYPLHAHPFPMKRKNNGVAEPKSKKHDVRKQVFTRCAHAVHAHTSDWTSPWDDPNTPHHQLPVNILLAS
jgi:hypothetical protein